MAMIRFKEGKRSLMAMKFKENKRSFPKKPKKATPKSKASAAMSRYIRLRDAIAYCKERGIFLRQFTKPEDIIGRCCTCDKVKSWIRMDAGHWQGRGMGGSSGVYFDERNVDLQCKPCNGFMGGETKAHESYILGRYGESIRDELEIKHRLQIDMGDMAMMATEQMYKEKYNRLLSENGF